MSSTKPIGVLKRNGDTLLLCVYFFYNNDNKHYQRLLNRIVYETCDPEKALFSFKDYYSLCEEKIPEFDYFFADNDASLGEILRKRVIIASTELIFDVKKTPIKQIVQAMYSHNAIPFHWRDRPQEARQRVVKASSYTSDKYMDAIMDKTVQEFTSMRDPHGSIRSFINASLNAKKRVRIKEVKQIMKRLKGTEVENVERNMALMVSDYAENKKTHDEAFLYDFFVLPEENTEKPPVRDMIDEFLMD